MADNSPPPPPPPQPPAISNNPNPTQYWCHQCNKRVPVETLPDHPDVICFECKNGFVESISVSSHIDDETPSFGNEFLHILRSFAMAAREDDEPPPPPSDHPAGDNDFLRIELDRWNHGNVNFDNDEYEQNWRQIDQARAQLGQIRTQLGQISPQLDQNRPQLGQIRPQLGQVRSQFDDDDDDEAQEEQIDNQYEDDDDDDADLDQRHRRDILRLRLRDFANRAASRRNRILDWAEILMQLEDQPIGFRLQFAGDDDAYVGNPGDYVDAAGYEALLQTLADNDTGGRRGAPPAAKSAVEGLVTVEVKSGDGEACAICKDLVFNNEGKVVKKLECGHMYHGDCIVTWLGSKNSCPVCRFELPTDDPEYEDDRKKRLVTVNAAVTDRGCSSGSGGAD